MTTTVRTTHLEVWITPRSGPGAGTPVRDPTAFAASVSLGFDQRTAEATVRRTGGGTIAISYWDEIEVRLGTTPGEGAASRFKGYIIPVENVAYPIEGILVCKGRLYRAQWVRNNEPGGTDLSADGAGVPDEAMVQVVLNACAVPVVAANLGGTGKALGSVYLGNPSDFLTPGPFTWAEGESGLACIERLDEVSVPDTADGRYRTFETLAGDIFRIALATAPAGTPDVSFTEGVDVLDARITRDPGGAANRVTVVGAPLPFTSSHPLVIAAETFTAATAFAPYLPPDLPAGEEGFASSAFAFNSPLIEKSQNADDGDVLSCEAVAQFLLAERNAVVDTLEFSTPRDDLLGPGQTIHLHSPRLALTDAGQHYWLQHLEITVDERGAFTQRLVCVRRS